MIIHLLLIAIETRNVLLQVTDERSDSEDDNDEENIDSGDSAKDK